MVRGGEKTRPVHGHMTKSIMDDIIPHLPMSQPISILWGMRLLISLLFFAQTYAFAGDRPLAEVAGKEARKLKAGGIAVGESLNGKVTFAGFASPKEQNADYEGKVLFEIGSITKVFTGLLLAQAVVEGKVTLETPIGKLLDAKLKFQDPRIPAITLKQLSTHTSGLPRLPRNHSAGVRQGDPYVAYDEKLMLEFLTQAKLEGEAPFPCSYSNLGVGLLGHLLGKVYGLSWEDAVVKKICAPLGLKDTRMTITNSKLPLAPPYQQEKKGTSWHFDVVAGAGALRSTTVDLVKFGQAMARPDNTPLVQAFALAMQPHAETDNGGHIGLGPFMSKRDGLTTWSHSGGTGGYRTGLQVIPEKNIVRVALINNTQLDVMGVISQTRVEPPRVMPKEVILEDALKQEYLGKYSMGKKAVFTIVLHKGQLWSQLTGQSFLPIYAKEKDRFFLKVVNAEIHFNREEGRVTSLTLFQNGREKLARRLPDPAPKIIFHTAEELKSYAGRYFVLGLKELTLTVRGRTLYAQLDGQDAAPVFDMGGERFEFDVVKAALVFNRNAEGEVIGLTLMQNGLLLPAAKQTSTGKK
jgi:D-alanyl-D-alanine-carboxypeptidase/D-alanyl-D-alanine-endopeptidase